jgi:integrase
MATATYTIYKRVQSAGKWRYRKAAIHTNGKIKPNIVIVDGKEEKHDGTYYLAHDGKWIGVGNDALEAQRKRGEYLTHSEYARLHAASNVVPITAPQSERKLVQTEVDAYLANLELAERVKKSVSDKRKFLTAFITIAAKKYVDEYDRDDVLRFRNRRMKDYEPKSVDTQMMCVVTFFNKWLRIKLGMEKSDWPEVKIPDPEPFSREEIVAMEKHSTGKINLLIRLFRSTGCRKNEIAHLRREDISPRTKEIMIRAKECHDCPNCISRGNIWKPKTKKGTRNIPISDGLLKELLARPKGVLFPTRDGKVDDHFLRTLARDVKASGVTKIKLHRFRDTSNGQKTRRGRCPTHEPHFKRRFMINQARQTLCLGQAARILIDM